MDGIPRVVRPVGPNGHARSTATEDSNGAKRPASRGQVLTMRPDKHRNQASVKECGAAALNASLGLVEHVVELGLTTGSTSCVQWRW